MDERERQKNEKGEQNGTEKPDARTAARKEAGERESIEAMRERLYSRGRAPSNLKRSTLSKNADTQKVSRSWGLNTQGQNAEGRTSNAADSKQLPTQRAGQSAGASQKTAAASDVARASTPGAPPTAKLAEGDAEAENLFMKNTKKKKGYRVKLALSGLVFFVLAMALSSAFIWLGDNTISGENISINISDDQFTIGGGEKLSFRIAVANQNTVPIESATLIINYPPGTQSAENPGEELFSERIQLDVVDPGEALNVPVEAVVFGEENEERIITAALEYRVRGSNATFFKEADPLRLKISSSPVTLRINAVESISSGQEMEIDVVVTSNSPSPLSDVLVKASYPSGFDFTESSIDTVAGQDTWLIESLEPEEETSFTVRGLVLGESNEEKVFRFSIGVPNERDRFNLASTFSTAESQVQIEEPFLDIETAVNGNVQDDPVVIDTEETAAIDITFTNTQSDTIYDGVIEARLSGNAISEIDVEAPSGHYDSTTNTATWDSVDVNGLSEIPPGQSSLVQLRLTPDRDIARTPEITLDVTARGQRVYDDRVPQELEGTVSRTIRVESKIDLTAEALYSTGDFTNSGPIPPVAEETTQYTLNFEVQNGSNDVTDAEVSAVLPSYVTWLDLKTSGDTITYDAPTRTITWDIGDMDANELEEASVQVSFTPSFSQVDTTPTILQETRFRATDRFTGTVLRANTAALTTALYNDPDEDTHNGRVQEED